MKRRNFFTAAAALMAVPAAAAKAAQQLYDVTAYNFTGNMTMYVCTPNHGVNVVIKPGCTFQTRLPRKAAEEVFKQLAGLQRQHPNGFGAAMRPV